MCAAPAPRGPQGALRESAQVLSGEKKRAPAWSGTEVLTLLELWGEEEAVQALHTWRRNANIYGRMSQGLADKGHHPRTLQQVRAKVKELRQGYMKAREQSSVSGAAPVHCTYYEELDRILGGQEPMSAPVLVQTGLHTPVQHSQQEVPRDDVEEEEEAEEQMEDTLTLTLQPVPETEEALQALSDAGEGTSAGPAAAVRCTTPVPPPTRSHSTRRHWRTYNDLLKQHVEAMEKMERTMANMQETMAERAREEARWHTRLLQDFLPEWSSMCATARESLAVPGPLPLGTPPAHPAPAPSDPPSSPSAPSDPPSSPSAPATPSSPSAPATPPALPLPPPLEQSHCQPPLELEDGWVHGPGCQSLAAQARPPLPLRCLPSLPPCWKSLLPPSLTPCWKSLPPSLPPG
ncbi:uncharacterized protein LOC142829124 [Pelodiscus sinensis]|uniref:uncharacterized protein LOC142829124 n=1 Tax=Pelodiscus sinensis TaxID=13735 RepID=UPI003F6CA304